MALEVPEHRVAGRALPLPEEAGPRADPRGAAEEILRESEQRVDEVTRAPAPGDAAKERRRSEDVAGP